MLIKIILLLGLILCSGNYFAKSRPQRAPPKCGYESCHPVKPHMLNVHLVAHTHDDVGWLKTVDQYYYGSRSLIQKAGVQYILDSVVQELLKDPKKRFIYVESAFFFKWWSEQSDDLKDDVKMLVNEGRLEFIGGAWSMNDEATAHYQSIIDQFAWGLKRLNDTFGECGRPRVGWQIDPFGHSREMASMFAQMGFDGMFFGRLDYQDKDERLTTQKAEMIWRASANLGDSSNLFTGALYNNYQPPEGFCFDILCADEPIIDNKHSPDYNVEKRIDKFFEFVQKMSKSYRTKNVLITMGEDFHYQDANVWFKNLDKLIKYGNERQKNNSDINLIYSTPSCYLKSLHDAGISWPTKDDDFFPYASDPHAYWTGYFTSRPTLKRFERVGNHFLQVCKQLATMTPKMAPDYIPHLSFMRETMGIMQHHDAVTGTEKEHVASDYAKRLDVGLRACGGNAKAILNRLSSGDDEDTKTETKSENQNFEFDFKTCTLLNISSCVTSETSDKFVLTLYNPLSHSTFEYIRIPVPDVNYVIRDYKGVKMVTQFVPIHESVRNLTFRHSAAQLEMVFRASELPPMGYKSYYVKKEDTHGMDPVSEPPNRSSLTTIGNDNIKLTFDTNGFLSAVSSDKMTRIVNQEFLYYQGAVGDNREFKNRSSGAYIFRPVSDFTHSLTMQPDIIVYRGNLVEEVHQQFNSWVSQVVRVYREQKFAEFEWMIGPIPIKDNVAKEIITRFNSDIKSEGIFYTDSNGREMIKRKINHRDTWNVKLLEKSAGNYYPITTKISINDDQARMSILTDRAQGGSSLGDGSLELMLHRRLLHDDAFGVGEALNEMAYGKGLVVRGTHYFFLGSTQSTSSPTSLAEERFTQLDKLLPTWKFFSDATDLSFEEWQTKYNNVFSSISLSLPQNIHLMTFEPWHQNQILIRFEHILEKDEDPEYSKILQFNLKDVLRGYKIEDLRETTMDGNAWLDEKRRFEFVPDPENVDSETYGLCARSSDSVQFLDAAKPMVETKYSDEEYPSKGLCAESNRLKRKQDTTHQLNLVRSEKLRRLKIDVSKLDLQDNSDTKFIIELSPMQIRTYILYIAKGV